MSEQKSDNTVALVLIAALAAGAVAYFSGSTLSEMKYSAVNTYVLNDQIKAQADITQYACGKHYKTMTGKLALGGTCDPVTVSGFLTNNFTRTPVQAKTVDKKQVQIVTEEIAVPKAKKP